MMKYRTYIILTIFWVAAAGFLGASAQENPITCSSVSSRKILLLKTPWEDSANPAALSYFNCGKRIATVYAWSDWAGGNYHRFQHGDELWQNGFYTDGFVSLGHWNFYGKFDYFVSSEKNVKWVDVMFPYDDNPYIIGDSIGGNYSREFFNMEGKGAYHLSDWATLGFDVKYLAAVGAKRKDPRPENTITSFDISPGVIFNLNKIKLGANFRYQGSKEDIEISTVTSNPFQVFYFKGLGVFSSTTEKDKRSNASTLLGGGLQINFDGNSIANVTEINFHKKITDIKRGTSFPLQIVSLERFQTEAATTFHFQPGSSRVNKLKLFFTDKHLYGHEPVVEPKSEQVNYQWSTVAKYTLYWHNEQQYGASYSYYHLLDDNHFNWGGVVEAKINPGETSYYFVPEYNRQKITLFHLNATFEKGFRLPASQIVLTVDGGYRFSHGNSLGIVEDEPLLKTVNTRFVQHDFDYLVTDSWNGGVTAKIGKNIMLGQSPAQLFLETGYRHVFSGLPGNQDWKTAECKIGMNF